MKELFQTTIKNKGFFEKKKFTMTIFSSDKEALPYSLPIGTFEKDLKITSVPVKRKIFTVNRSPCGQNKSKEQFSYFLYTKTYTFVVDETFFQTKIFKQVTRLTGARKNISFKWQVEPCLYTRKANAL